MRKGNVMLILVERNDYGKVSLKTIDSSSAVVDVCVYND